MSPADQDAYRQAIEPWKRKADRERKVITHVVWREGQAVVTMVSRKAENTLEDFMAETDDGKPCQRSGLLL